jgi:hypothetical protein
MYPTPTELVRAMARAAGLRLLADDLWQWPTCAADLEWLAASLSAAERRVLVHGDPDDIADLVAERGLDDLNAFLGAVFDGDLTDAFCPRGAGHGADSPPNDDRAGRRRASLEALAARASTDVWFLGRC